MNEQRGNSIVEFALVSVFLVPLLLGTVNVGMNLTRSIQATQVSRDAGHMFARFVDFSEPGNQNIIIRLAYGLGMAQGSGKGKVVLSRVMYVGQLECEAGGLQLNECTNYQQPVITQQIIIGNPSLRASHIGEPPSNLFDSKGEMSSNDYLTDIRARAQNFNSILAMQPGEYAYVSEAIFRSPEYDFPGMFEDTNVYARTIF